MKKALFSLLFIALAAVGFAQQTEAELVRSAFRLEKKAAVAEFIGLSNDEAAKFWPIYEKYETKRVNSVGTPRFALISEYVKKMDKMDETSADNLVKQSIAIQKKEVAIREKYYAMVKKAVSTEVAVKFYQVEDVIAVGTRMELYEQIPMFQSK
jgi:hypothetical protein